MITIAKLWPDQPGRAVCDFNARSRGPLVRTSVFCMVWWKAALGPCVCACGADDSNLHINAHCVCVCDQMRINARAKQAFALIVCALEFVCACG